MELPPKGSFLESSGQVKKVCTGPAMWAHIPKLTHTPPTLHPMALGGNSERVVGPGRPTTTKNGGNSGNGRFPETSEKVTTGPTMWAQAHFLMATYPTHNMGI